MTFKPSSSLKVTREALYDRLQRTFYYSSIVAMALSAITWSLYY